jgi:hypothetical protein
VRTDGKSLRRFVLLNGLKQILRLRRGLSLRSSLLDRDFTLSVWRSSDRLFAS